MPVLTKNNEYVIPITMKCNWNCNYCAINNKYDQNIIISKNNNIKKINNIPNYCRCTLTGGEPGLVDKDEIIEYLNLLKIKKSELYLETNGLFIEKYPDLIKNFYEILYHCSENLEDKIEYFNFNNIRYLLIITDQNVNRLNEYIKKNFIGIKFDLIPVSYPFQDDIRGPQLSLKNKNMIISKFYKYMTDDSIKRFYKDKDFKNINWFFK